MSFPALDRKRLAGLRLALLGKDPSSAQGRPSARRRARFQLEGLEDRCLLSITEFPLPSPNNGLASIAAGPDGNLWFTDGGGGDSAIAVETLNSADFVVTQQPPTSVSAGTDFGLTVQAEDSSGNLDSSFNGTVTVALAKNPGGATLDGTLSMTASNGLATFSNLTLTSAAAGYTLLVSGSGVGSATTNAFTVTPAAASK